MLVLLTLTHARVARVRKESRIFPLLFQCKSAESLLDILFLLFFFHSVCDKLTLWFVRHCFCKFFQTLHDKLLFTCMWAYFYFYILFWTAITGKWNHKCFEIPQSALRVWLLFKGPVWSQMDEINWNSVFFRANYTGTLKQVIHAAKSVSASLQLLCSQSLDWQWWCHC